MPKLKSAPRRFWFVLSAFLASASASAAVISRCEVPGGAAASGPNSIGAVGAPGAGPSARALQAPGLISGLPVSAPPVVSNSAAPASISLSARAAALPAPRIVPAASPSAPEAKSAPALSAERRAQYQSLSSGLAADPATVTPENSRDLASQFFGSPKLSAAPVESSELIPVADAVSAPLAPTGPAAPRAPPQAAAARRQSYQPETGLRAALKDRAFHSRLLIDHLYWYSVTHIKDLWPGYKEKLRKLAAQEGSSAVTRPRAFFSYMRVMGEAGVFRVLGFPARSDQAVLEESRRTFERFFDGPGIGPAQRLAFERFLDRVAVFNLAHRAPPNMKKHIRDALLAASVMPARAIAPFFDSLAVKDKSAEIEEFQRQGAPERIKTYREAVRQTLAEEPDAPDRIVGVVLMGSFARGGATPTSDMDTELLARDGRGSRAKAFSDRLIARWESLGLQQANPITPHEHPLHPSRGLLSLIHPDGDFLVFSDDAALEEALAPALDAAASPARYGLTWPGRLGRVLEFTTVYAVTCWTDLKRAFGR